MTWPSLIMTILQKMCLRKPFEPDSPWIAYKKDTKHYIPEHFDRIMLS